MSRLTSKRMLSRRRHGKTDWYRARLSGDEYRQARSQAEVGARVDEYSEPPLRLARQMEPLDPEGLWRLARGA